MLEIGCVAAFAVIGFVFLYAIKFAADDREVAYAFGLATACFIGAVVWSALLIGPM